MYTYREGAKLALVKERDRMVIRLPIASVRGIALPDVNDLEAVSANSTRVRVPAAKLDAEMETARRIAPTHHAYNVSDTGAEFLITDRVIVTFKRSPKVKQLDAFAANWGLLLADRYTDRDFLFQLSNHAGVNPVKLVVKLTEQEDSVARAENDLNHRAKRSNLQLPTDPSYARQWFLHTNYTHAEYDSRSSVNCEGAWRLMNSFGNPNVVIALTDDGCKLDHRDLDSPNKFAGWAYFSGTRLVTSNDVDADRTLMYSAGENHGTSCAGVAAAEADSVLTVGAAPGCRLLPIKWELSGAYLLTSDSKLMTVLNYIADKADVMSNSWGRVPTALYATAVIDRIRQLARNGGRRGNGIVFLWAAGSDNCPINHDASTTRIPYTDGWEVGPGGDWTWIGPTRATIFRNNLVGIPGVAHVGALASNAQRSHYSNYGTGLELCAPSGNRHAYYRAVVTGLGVTTATSASAAVTHAFGGTSSATPLTAGIAALVISANPTLSALDVLAILKSTASRNLNFNGYARTAPSTFDADTNWDVSPVPPFDRPDFQTGVDPDGPWSPWFGHGRVDAEAAVAEALRRSASGSGAAGAVNLTIQPNIPIPDHSVNGVRSVQHVAEVGRVRDIAIGVDITHTWIGDLRIQITAPNGRAATLHDRAGTNADNINRTYNTTNTSALAALLNIPAAGDWTLFVQDLARYDSGTLNAWTLSVTIVPSPTEVVDVAAVRIPDNNPAGVTRTIEIGAGAAIDDVAIKVDITHPYVHDLHITITPPNGSVIPLPLGVVASNGHLRRTWRAAEVVELNALRGTSRAGPWKLHVADRARLDEGKLNQWSIELTP